MSDIQTATIRRIATGRATGTGRATAADRATDACFQDVHLVTDVVRGRAGQGGPLGGAVAEVFCEVADTGNRPQDRGRVSRLAGRFARGPRTARLVIDAPTWRLDRPIEPDLMEAAEAFAAEVNSAARRLADRTWRPLAG